MYPFEYKDDWDKFREIALLPKETLNSKLNMAGVNEEAYEHTCRVWAEFEIKN